MEFVKIIIHAVWGTKNREPYMVKDVSMKNDTLRAVRAKARTWRVSDTPASRLGLIIGRYKGFGK